MRDLLCVLLLAGCGAASSSPAGEEDRPPAPPAGPAEVVAEPPSEPLRAEEILTQPDEWLEREVVLDVYERVFDAEHTSAARPNEVSLDVQDVGTAILNIAAARTDAERRDGVLGSLPSPLAPPFRVRGTVVRDDTRVASGRVWRLVLAREITALEWPTPEPLPSVQALTDDPSRWQGRYVTVTASWYAGFEASYLGTPEDRVWIDFYFDALGCPRPDCGFRGSVQGRLRVTGFVYTAGEYGHLGVSRALLQATHVDCESPLECVR